MAKLVFGLNQSLDGYVDHAALGPPDAALARHFLEQVRGLAGVLYGRKIYEIMGYWNEDQPDWDVADREFAAAWRRLPKWVVSRTLRAAGNDTLIGGDLKAEICELKARLEGEIDVAGPSLAGSLTEMGLIDEYRLYLHPVVLGRGTPFFAGVRPRLRLIASERIGEDVVKLAYIPA